MSTSYRRAIATAIIGAALTLSVTLGACGPTKDTGATVTTCPSPTEDAPITCDLDPSKRYDYGHGAWHITNRTSAPTGAALTATESSYDGRG